MFQFRESLSVIIATYNRCTLLKVLLENLRRQETNGSRFYYEVIIADNGSHDGTRRHIEKLKTAYHVPLRYVFESQKGKAYALNKALKVASGEIIAFTDDDVTLKPSWLQTLYETFITHEADGVGGSVSAEWVSERPLWLDDRLLRQIGVADHGDRSFIVTSLDTPFIGPNCAYRRSLFERLGGFNTTPGCAEDAEWFARALRSGAKLIYQPKAVVFHKLDGQRITKRAIAQRFFRNGTFAGTGWEGRTLFGIPVWVARYFVGLHGQAAWAWLQGKRDEALWHWLRRYYYLGIIATKMKRQEAFLIVPPRSSEAGTTRNASASK